MKSRSLLLLASAGLAIAHPSEAIHNHKRFHEIKARQAIETTVVSTVSVYELNGQIISYEELQEGLKNGTLVLDGEAPAPAPSSKAKPSSSASSAPVVIKAATPSTTPSTTPSAKPSTTSQAPPPPPSTTASSAAAPVTTSAAPSKAPVQNKAVQQPSASPASYGGDDSNDGDDGGATSGYGSDSGTGLTREYDNSVSCDEFPSAFGPVPVDYLGNNGWLAIMSPGAGSSSSSLDSLSVVSSCSEGSYCSYACPAGWEKTQWPTAQGATGQSVGGLLCKNGKLTLTRPDVPNLCSNSMEMAKVSVQNKLSKQVSVCRTDYPGTENMNIPLGLQPNEVSGIACPNGATAYKAAGKTTSAQYYVNPAGVDVETACKWGSPDEPYGNWAPVNIGAGFSNGFAWLSIFPNYPTQPTAQLDFKITIVGDVIGNGCTYENGLYNGAKGSGCTVCHT